MHFFKDTFMFPTLLEVVLMVLTGSLSTESGQFFPPSLWFCLFPPVTDEAEIASSSLGVLRRLASFTSHYRHLLDVDDLYSLYS